MSGLVDQYGNPLRKQLLTREVAGPTITGVRSPLAGYPADGLNPMRLASILREADQGEPLRYFELAEIIEERDPHYAGVLGTRKRSVSQIDVTVEAASDDAEDVRRADMVRDWLKRDELADEMFDIFDAVGKGVSFTEIIWDSSAGQWWPQRLEWRDPRWFTFDPKDLRTPMLRGGVDGNVTSEPLPAFKFIYTQIKAKSGLPIRSGIARIAVWAWMFKAFTLRDWAIFVQTYGQPIRIGKFHESASKEDKDILFRAVANIAGDCAAIVPQSMLIEFIQAQNVADGSELFERRADWLDRQISKAVLGQTNATDAQAGGLGSGQAQVHNDVREDIETADCKSGSAVLNRDLIRPWCDLEFGPPANPLKARYPRLVIARPKKEDLEQLTSSLNVLVPLGLKVSASEVRDKFGLSEPDDDEDVLQAAKPAVAPPVDRAAGQPAVPAITAPTDPADLTLHSAEDPRGPSPAEQLAAEMTAPAEADVTMMTAQIGAMLDRASSLGEFHAMLSSAYGDLGTSGLAEALAGGLAAAHAAGRSDLVDESA